MQEYAQVLNYAIPSFLLLILIEFIASRIKGVKVYRGLDTISSLSSGLTNSIKDVLGLALVIISYSWLVDKLAMFDIQSTIWLYVLAFIGKDFAGYWSHRFEHVINLFWNRHIIHHSSEEFNLSCALRQPISNLVAIFVFLYIPLAIIGVPARVVAVVAPLHLFLQFWYHTRLIKSMGFLEYVLVTPAHHRVHHAINTEYIDKNYSQIFIIWDRMFGTFQEELPNVEPIYGVKRPVKTWNPIIINFTHFWSLLKDAWRTKNWTDKIKIWFMPTGWRPDDVENLYKIYSIQDVYNFDKYDSEPSLLLQFWSFAQLLITTSLMLYMFNLLGIESYTLILVYAFFLFISIFSYTSLMDKSYLSIPFELAKFSLGIFLMISHSGWFALDSVIPFGSMFVLLYLFLSLGMTFFFYIQSRNYNLSLEHS